MKVFLRENERVYLNGAHIRVDRKVAIELLNKPKFLLENHIMPTADVDTPLKELYFTFQLMIIHSVSSEDGEKLLRQTIRSVLDANPSPFINQLVKKVQSCVDRDREYDALKLLRNVIQEQNQLGTQVDGNSRFGAMALVS